jgi:hypothetical protein
MISVLGSMHSGEHYRELWLRESLSILQCLGTPEVFARTALLAKKSILEDFSPTASEKMCKTIEPTFAARGIGWSCSSGFGDMPVR